MNTPPMPIGDEEAARQTYAYAAEQMNSGATVTALAQQLIDRGLSPEDASQVVRQTRLARTATRQSAGRRNMVYGALWCLGGLTVTYFSYQSAATGGGKYVVTWGAAAYGGFQFVRGLMSAVSD